MKEINNTFFEGERPLYAATNLHIDKVKFYPGESALKEASNILATNSSFMCKYPFWHNQNTQIKDCTFTLYSRAAIWYSQNISMQNTIVEAPKMFREVDGLSLNKVKLLDAQECCWNCKNIDFKHVEAKNADYIFMNSKNITIDDLSLVGNYSFQDAKNVTIRNAYLQSKDAFWNTENVTVYDSIIDGEYLGWHSKNLRLVNCKISGTQPFCYCKDLILDNCTFADNCDLAFEYSSVIAKINSQIRSVKNPLTGTISALGFGEIILDEHCKNPNACTFESIESLETI